MKESLSIQFLYHTRIGRLLLKFLVNPKISQVSAAYLSSSSSRWLIPFFVKKNKINMSYYQIPEGGFRSFNDFFTRKMEASHIWYSDGPLVSPCDGLLTYSKINKNSEFHIKHTCYRLTDLLNSEKLALEYQGGTAFIFRLTPAHYHRYIWTTSGFILDQCHIDGVLHSVRPICHELTDVFIQNTREYTIINTPAMGSIIQMEIGALLVGKISNHKLLQKTPICAGEEKGYFEYGGSSILLLVKNRVELSEDLLNRQKLGLEIPVVIGEQLIK